MFTLEILKFFISKYKPISPFKKAAQSICFLQNLPSKCKVYSETKVTSYRAAHVSLLIEENVKDTFIALFDSNKYACFIFSICYIALHRLMARRAKRIY